MHNPLSTAARRTVLLSFIVGLAIAGARPAEGQWRRFSGPVAPPVAEVFRHGSLWFMGLDLAELGNGFAGGGVDTLDATPQAFASGARHGGLRSRPRAERPAASPAEGPAPRTPALRVDVSPNPFNPQTVVTFDLPQPGRISVDIHDAAGRRVRHLLAEDLAAGAHSRLWDGRDNGGRAVAAGVYFVLVVADRDVAVRKVALVR